MKWRWVALPVYWAVLFTATHYPRVPMPHEIPHSDKAIHFAAFGLLAFVFWLAVPRVFVAAAVLIPYALVDEFTQQFVGRYSDVQDALANVAGIVCVLAALEVRRRRRERSE